MFLNAEKLAAEKVRNATAHDGRGDSGEAVDDKVDPSPTGRVPVGNEKAKDEAICKFAIAHGVNIIPHIGRGHRDGFLSQGKMEGGAQCVIGRPHPLFKQCPD